MAVEKKAVSKANAPTKPKVSKTISKAKAPMAIAKKTKAEGSTEPKVRKTRGPRKAKGGFAELEKIQKLYEKTKKSAQSDLKNQYDKLMAEAKKLKESYQDLFHENIDSAPRTKRGITKKVVGMKPFTLQEVESFIEQKANGSKDVKIKGRKSRGISKIEIAWNVSKSKEPEDVLRILK